MYGLFIVLNDLDKLKPIVKKMREMGVTGATIMDSIGAGQARKALKKSKSFLMNLVQSLEDGTLKNKTIFSVVEREEDVDKIMDAVEEIMGGDMKKPDSGIMFCIPVLKQRGGNFDSLVQRKEVVD
ncbi:MAG: P-II family nitrogen regulator [Clostridia bacterium]|nr:P-II family nitrogen regulator [Clostridia bacterium]